MEATQIIGIVLVKDEEKYIQRIISNIFCFCDKIIVADNFSTDNTADIVINIANRTAGKIEYHRISHPRESHTLIQQYVDKRIWVFAVDGDELYDPAGLSVLRQKILSGDFDSWWLILGNVLNCTMLNIRKRYAEGYLAPPCRSMTKLYNFHAIKSWDGPCPERLHGGTVIFKNGFARSLRLEIYKENSWETSFFRCLHLCFLERSTQDRKSKDGFFVRKNISDMNAERFHRKIFDKILLFFGKHQVSHWKQEKYMRGPFVQKEIPSFVVDEEGLK